MWKSDAAPTMTALLEFCYLMHFIEKRKLFPLSRI
jgi:hypothetical protein